MAFNIFKWFFGKNENGQATGDKVKVKGFLDEEVGEFYAGMELYVQRMIFWAMVRKVGSAVGAVEWKTFRRGKKFSATGTRHISMTSNASTKIGNATITFWTACRQWTRTVSTRRHCGCGSRSWSRIRLTSNLKCTDSPRRPTLTPTIAAWWRKSFARRNVTPTRRL